MHKKMKLCQDHIGLVFVKCECIVILFTGILCCDVPKIWKKKWPMPIPKGSGD